MYGSYGSYSAMCVVQMSAPMDIGTRRIASQQESTCAFPSWPRRSSLSDSDCEERASSYLSDEDLFPSDPIEDDAQSISSSGSVSSPFSTTPHIMTEAELAELERERAAHQREVMRFLMSEKERRRQQAKRQRRGSSGSSKKSPKSKLSAMTPIAEGGE